MSPQDNKTLVDRFIQGLFSHGDEDALALLTADYVDHAPFPGATPDRASMQTAAAVIRTAFPDWTSAIHRCVAEGDLVAEHFTASGTHSGTFFGVQATGRTATLHGINIFRVQDRLIAERWGVLDFPGLIAQLQ
jgi:steroid delta-isomerase-like uncharacterized protein